MKNGKWALFVTALTVVASCQSKSENADNFDRKIWECDSIIADCRITIHEGWRKISVIHEVAIHEYAHHVAMTEFDHRFKPHGREFKTIYSILMDSHNSKYDFIQPDRRYYLKPEKRIHSITLNTK